MNYLFLHQNFPGQFAHLAPALVDAGHHVVALTSRVKTSQKWRGVDVIAYAFDPPKDQKLHPWLTTMNAATHRGAVVYRAALALKKRGYRPDVIVAHSGWGEALFAPEVWPEARLGIFCEFHYNAEGADVDFDPEFLSEGEIGKSHRMRLKNMAMRMQLEGADAGISPTHWQADAYPPDLRPKIDVIFDGIDTAALAPNPEARLTLDGHGSWSREDEVVTFVNRNLEPYRGFHVFMRALPDLLARRPEMQVIVVGEDGVSYGAAPKQGGTWREVMLAEMRPRLSEADLARVHFVGRVQRDDFTRLLQVSRAHLYLTYPFVLSWSMLEAMSVGCAIVASGTQPVREVIDDGEQGVLFDFFDGPGMVDALDRVLGDADLRDRLGRAARQRVMERYDLRSVCLPAQFRWLERLAASRQAEA